MKRTNLWMISSLAVLTASAGANSGVAQEYLNGIEWKEPPIVTPGSTNSDAPSDAVVLFDGTEASMKANWVHVKEKRQADWEFKDGAMQSTRGAGYIKSKAEFGDCQLHIEWAAPVKVEGAGQGRGNSGVFLMGIAEVQVLDNYENPTYPDGTAGAVYGVMPPMVNALRKPGEWQSYDIVWVGPRFLDGKLLRPAAVTVFLNGVLLHLDRQLLGPTRHRQATGYTPHPHAAPLVLQDHGDLVRFRNIWYRPLTDYDEA